MAQVADKGGGLLEGIGTALIPQTMAGIQQNRERRDQRGALDQLLKLNAPSPIDRQDLSVGTNAPGSVMADLIKPPERFQQETQDYRAQALPLAKRLDPKKYAESMLADLLPSPEEPFTLKEGEVRYGRGGNVLARALPKPPEGFKVGQSREIQRGSLKVFQEFDGQKWNDISSGPAFAPREAKEAPGLGKQYLDTFGGAIPANHMPEIVNGKMTSRTVPIPGSEADPAVIETKRVQTLKQALPKAQGALDSTIADIKQTEDLIDEILSPASDTGLGDVTGFGGGTVGDAFTLGGTEGAKVRAKTKQLEARTMLDSLANLKASSPTGASGMGALSEREGEALRNARAALDRTQDMASYKAALVKYKEALAGTKTRLQSTFQQEYAPVMGGGGQADPLGIR